MPTKDEESSIELKISKVSPEILERVELFNKALNLYFEEHDDFEEISGEEYQIQKQKELPKPERMQVLEGFVQRFGVSLDYCAGDIIEVALFKSVMQQDQERFSALAEHPDLHPKVKAHVLSYSVVMACGFRDIQVVGFLAKNMKNLTELVIISMDGSEEPCSPVVAVLSGFCKNTFLDRELINILFENGLDLNLQRNGYSAYYTIINSAPEEFSIEMLDCIQDINAVQYDHFIDNSNSETNTPIKSALKPTYYLVQAIEEGKFKLALTMIEMGATPNVQSSCGYNLLNIILACAGDDISENALEFIKYLFENGHVTSLSAKRNEFGADLLKFHEVAKLVVLSGLEIEGLTEKDTAKYIQIKAKVLFEQKALADIKVIKTAYTEYNEESIKESFLPKKTVDSILKYYLHDYKSKFKEQVEGIEGKFFTDLANTVVKHLKIYT